MRKVVPVSGIHCKTETMVEQFKHLTGCMQSVILYVNWLCSSALDFYPVWTSFLRNEEKDKPATVHTYGRGADMSKRVLDTSGYVKMRDITKEEVHLLLNKINKIFPYGKDGLKSAIYHAVGDNPEHFHLQTAK